MGFLMLPNSFPQADTIIQPLSTPYQMLIVIQLCLALLMDVCENQMRESVGTYFENYAVLSEVKGPRTCLQQEGSNSVYY